jgi:hypothetical protein
MVRLTQLQAAGFLLDVLPSELLCADDNMPE